MYAALPCDCDPPGTLNNRCGQVNLQQSHAIRYRPGPMRNCQQGAAQRATKHTWLVGEERVSTQHSRLNAQQVIRPIGIFGGTFDPIHNGHLRLAQEALEQCDLAAVHFIPAGTPPHRGTPHADPEQRLELVRLALQGNDGFVLDEREIHLGRPCYTVDTLSAMRAELGARQSLCLLMGSDAFLQLHTWHEWHKLFELAHIVIVQRSGRPLGNAIDAADRELRDEYLARLAPAARILHETPGGAITVMDMPTLDISATGIRERLASGRSIRYLLPDAATDYILTHGLYQC
jgi:nicotinate-nucleotide adenylyltransferase